VKVQVPVTAREVQVALPGLHMVVPVRVGHLDPPATTSGARQRLDHLGYHRPTGAGPDDDARALRQFQRDHGLPETGEADEATRRALEDAHRS
jgi:peptidoglycan hydrolase-like protein with peptidoglycan-binding domain